MNPNSSPTPASSPEYLDQIALKSPKKTGILGQRPLLVAALCAALLIAIGLTIATSIINTQPKKISVLAARLESMQDTVDKSSDKIKSTKLRAYNSNLELYLTNTIRDYETVAAKLGLNIKKLSKSTVEAESNTDTLSKLEDARLNAVFDRTYANEMAYEMKSTLALMREVHKSSNSASLRNFLSASIKNLDPVQEQFANFNDID